MTRNHLIAALLGIVALLLPAAGASAMYHPTLGRFIQRDPGSGSPMRIGNAGAAPVGKFIPMDQYADGMNLYEYVASRATGSVDPSGKILVVMSGVMCPESHTDRVKDWTRDAILTAVKPYDRAASPMMLVRRASLFLLVANYQAVLRKAYRDFKRRKKADPCSLEQFVAIGHSHGASAIYHAIRAGTFAQADPRLAPAYFGMIDRVLPLHRDHDLTGKLAGLSGTLVDDFHGAWRGKRLPGASVSFDVSKDRVIEDPFPDPRTGKTGTMTYQPVDEPEHERMPQYFVVLDQISFRAREVYLKRVREEHRRRGAGAARWDSSKPGKGW